MSFLTRPPSEATRRQRIVGSVVLLAGLVAACVDWSAVALALAVMVAGVVLLTVLVVTGWARAEVRLPDGSRGTYEGRWPR